MNKIFLQNESGRSMVEMLGVLAVMGILSIGGIAGFNYAMDKSKANDILDGVNKRAIALSTYTMLGTNITSTTLNAEFSNRIGDSTVALNADNTGFDLIVSGVSEAVCDHVLNNGAKMASEILLKEGEDDRVVWKQGVKSDHTCAETDNEIVFAFNASLDGRQGTGSLNQPTYDKNGCPSDKPVLNASGVCEACPTTVDTNLYGWGITRFYGESDADCKKCGSQFVYKNGTCQFETCPEGYIDLDPSKPGYDCRDCRGGWYFHGVSEAELQRCVQTCPNRQIASDGYSSRSCILPCEGQNEIRDKWGLCVNCESTTGYWDVGNGSCQMCPGKNFKNVQYYDFCVLVSHCPEGDHTGFCCKEGEVFYSTSTVSAYRGGRPIKRVFVAQRQDLALSTENVKKKNRFIV